MILMDRGAIWDGGEVREGIRPHPPAPSPQKDEERGRKKREFLKTCIDTGDPAIYDIDGSRSDMGRWGGLGGN
jgi:hypothetical protein